MNLVVWRKREHLPRFLKAKLRLAGMLQQACFTCKTLVRLKRHSFRIHVQQKQLLSQVAARGATFWKRYAHSPCLDNNLQICCLTERAPFSDLSWDWSLNGAPEWRKQSLYILGPFFFLSLRSPLPCVFVYGLPRPREFILVVLGHKGHFPHSWEDVPTHVILPTCPAYTHVHTRAHDLSVLHPPADPDVLHKLPAEGKAALWQGATKARWSRLRRRRRRRGGEE